MVDQFEATLVDWSFDVRIRQARAMQAAETGRDAAGFQWASGRRMTSKRSSRANLRKALHSATRSGMRWLKSWNGEAK